MFRIGEKRHFPYLTLVQLAVTEDKIGVIRIAVHFHAHRNACGSGRALTQRAGAHINAGSVVAVCVARQIGMRLVERFQHFHREKSLER